MHVGLVTLTTFSIALFYSLNVFSQVPAIQWQKCYGGTGAEQATSIFQTSDSGYVVAGRATSSDGDVTGYHGGPGDFWIIKIDALGTLQWQKCLGGTSSEEAHCIVQTTDGGYIVVGPTFSNNGDVSGNHGSDDCWVVKLDSSGLIQWQKCYGGSTGVEGAFSIIQTADSGYAVAGTATSNDGDVVGNHGMIDVWILKLDYVGNLQWQKCLGGTTYDIDYSIIQTSDGGYAVAGATASNDGDVSGNHDTTGSNYDCWIVRLGSNGNIIWQKCFGGTGNDVGISILQIQSGEFMVGGVTGSNDGDVVGYHDTTSLGEDAWILKLDGAGNLIWQKCFGGSNFDDLDALHQTNDGGFIFSGETASNDYDVSGNHGGYDYWVVKIDNGGNIIWQRCLGGTGGDVENFSQPTFDGGYITAGWGGSNDGDASGSHGNYDFWVVKLETDITGVKQEESDYSFTTTLSPNPFHETATLTINTNKMEEGTIEIKNILGTTAQPPKHFTGNKIKLQRNSLPAGIYFYTLTTKEGTRANGKFIIY